jgi:two-component system, NarL family, invasion response regulator UvrY
MLKSQQIEKRFLLVDDHTLIRSALASLLKHTYKNAIIDELPDGTRVIEKLAVTSYDLIVMDIQMPNTETLWLINHIHLTYPAIPVFIYSMAAEKIYALRVLKAGARGFISKESSIEDLKGAIETVLHGKRYISQNVAEIISLQSLTMTDNPFSTLSTRELQIASLLLAGNTLSEMAKMLHLQNSTVGTHKARIFQKLKITNLLELKEMSAIYSF